MSYKYEIKNIDDISVITLIGELKIYDLNEYTDFFDKLLEEHKYNLILNMSEISYIDSTAIGLLINIKRTVTEKGGNLTICEPRPEVMSVFKMTGVDQFIQIYTSEEESINGYK